MSDSNKNTPPPPPPTPERVMTDRPNIERITNDRSAVRNNPRFKTAKSHRCNDHLEDVFQAFHDQNTSWKEWRATVSTFFTCVKSEPGSEPPRRRSDNSLF